MTDKLTLTPVARIRSLFGSDGEMAISLYGAFPDNYTADRPFFALVDGLQVPLFAGHFERRGVTGALAQFDDIDTLRRAEEFIGTELFMQLGPEEDDDEFCMEDLIGFAAEASVVGQKQKRRGTLTDYYDSEANPLFELEIDGKRSLIPAAEEFFAHIDFENRCVKLVLPEGLLELE